MIKRIVVAVVILAFGLSVFACAEVAHDRQVFVYGLEKTDAILTIYAFDGQSERVFGIPNLGHAFVSIKNTSDEEMAVGYFTLQPDEEVSVGTWGQAAHWGIWYNLEAYYMSIGRYSGIVTLSRGIALSDIEVVNEFIHVSDYWAPTVNCSGFAVGLWNAAVGGEIDSLSFSGLITPSVLKSELKRFETFSTDKRLTAPENMGYFDGENYITCTAA